MVLRIDLLNNKLYINKIITVKPSLQKAHPIESAPDNSIIIDDADILRNIMNNNRYSSILLKISYTQLYHVLDNINKLFLYKYIVD